MRWSKNFIHTARESPADAEVVSHRLMARAGMLRRHAAGIYSYLPLGWRSMAKLMEIVRSALARADSVELSMPAVQPAELWQESGRWQKYGKELLRFQDRHQRDFCFGPTHEEVVTELIRRDIKSYRQLPVNLFQIQTKFRDEVRPRFGLMRGREFLMKDAYSFHANEESLDETYRAMHRAYSEIFQACGLDFIVVEADSGSIGGSFSHEFMVVASTGESAVVRCSKCDYAANVEKAATKLEAPPPGEDDVAGARVVETPGLTTVAEVAAFLGTTAAQMVKTLLYQTDRGPAAVLVRGDREVNEVKLAAAGGFEWATLATAEEVGQWTGAPVGFAGPVGLAREVRLLADHSVRELRSFVCGANQADRHLVGVDWEREAPSVEWFDVLRVEGGDPCPRCAGTLEPFRGIEVGHIFKLGTQYSEAMGCTYTDEEGQERPMIMGCYGLGIGRTVAAAIEQNHDEGGISWPAPLAPYSVALLALNPRDEKIREAAEGLYRELMEDGIDVLYDDRDERPGVKFKDADLIGFPVRVVVGAKALEQGGVEISSRRDREHREIVGLDSVREHVRVLLARPS